MRFQFRAIPCLLAAVLTMAAGEGEVVAKRGDLRLTGADMRDALTLLDPSARAQVTGTPQALAVFARDRLLNQAVLAEARAKGWDKRPDIVRKANEARDAMLLQTYLISLIPADAAYPSEAEITATYESNRARLVLPRQYRLAQIVILTPPNGPPGAAEAGKKLAEEMRALAATPNADFAALARKHSQDPMSAEKGGEIGWLREPEMLPTVREAVTGLAEKGVSQPTRSTDGWHILKVLEIRAPAQVPIDDARQQIIQALRQGRVQRLTRAYLDDMLKAQPIQVNEIELTKQVDGGK